MIIGPSDARSIFYLPTPPILASDWRHENNHAIEQLIADNGNHWRKIMVIMAKLMSPSDEWRDYLANHLLKHHEAIYINAIQLSPHATQHFICGNKMQHQLEQQMKNCTNGQIIALPYLDYRQCPNALIEETRTQWLSPQC
ncbi:DUF6942 family protein [Shewanella waksmanii]|uniref:DUF6942 family protein n=1 Tax=Shewanella waksmanii TaxID=213783 RepID=UPI0004B57324|nr:hypothetical protein [Shewanella waksmanii]